MASAHDGPSRGATIVVITTNGPAWIQTRDQRIMSVSRLANGCAPMHREARFPGKRAKACAGERTGKHRFAVRCPQSVRVFRIAAGDELPKASQERCLL